MKRLSFALLLLTGSVASCDVPPEAWEELGHRRASPSHTPSAVDGGPRDSRLCPQRLGPKVAIETIDASRAALQGRWLLCSDLGLTHERQEGMEIVGDRFALLRRTASGTLAAVRGAESEGSLEFIDTSLQNGRPTIQVNFVLDEGGTVISTPLHTSDPETLTINNNGVFEYRYVRSP
jgi:hypothetical protein